MEKWNTVIDLLQGIEKALQQLNKDKIGNSNGETVEPVHLAFKGAEIYLLHKAFVDSGGTVFENYKSLLEKTVPYISNKTQKGFSVQSFCKYSDKVEPETKENVKRFLMKMIRNIDSYD